MARSNQCSALAQRKAARVEEGSASTRTACYVDLIGTPSVPGVPRYWLLCAFVRGQLRFSRQPAPLPSRSLWRLTPP